MAKIPFALEELPVVMVGHAAKFIGRQVIGVGFDCPGAIVNHGRPVFQIVVQPGPADVVEVRPVRVAAQGDFIIEHRHGGIAAAAVTGGPQTINIGPTRIELHGGFAILDRRRVILLQVMLLGPLGTNLSIGRENPDRFAEVLDDAGAIMKGPKSSRSGTERGSDVRPDVDRFREGFDRIAVLSAGKRNLAPVVMFPGNFRESIAHASSLSPKRYTMPTMTRTFPDRVYLVTGASRGIGRRIAIKLATRGARVALVGRTPSDLEETARSIESTGGQSVVIPADLTDSSARERVIASTLAAWGQLDGLVNAAGVAAHGEFSTGTETVLRQVMEINFFAAAEMIRLAVPALTASGKAGRQPVVMNVASLVGRFGMPGISEHSASKHALVGLTESLRCEFVRYGIDVLLTAPSIVKTDNHEAHLLRSDPIPSVDFEKGIDPDMVAEAIVTAIARNQSESYIGRLAFWVNMGRRLGPRMLRKVLWRRFRVQ